MHRLAVTTSIVLCAAAFVGCASTDPGRLATDSAGAQIFEDMGAVHRGITTSSPEAQAFFDQGLAWMYSFNHDEAVRSFSRAAELDPECAMAWWGISLCQGPNYNDPEMTDARSAEAWIALREARARIANTTPVERDLIEALSKRYSEPWPQDRSLLDQAYTDAMALVWAAYPDDADVAVLYAEAMMDQRPWKLYDGQRQPEGDTPLIVATLERAMELDPENPGANHLYIHAVEPSVEPGRALAAADRLCNQVPAAGHMNHMPSHIYIQTGKWAESITQNSVAMLRDDTYRTLAPEIGIQHMYMVHNNHMLAFSAMMVGREGEAMAAARDMWADLPPEVLEAVGAYLDLWMTSVYDVQKRFGRWDDILAEPAPPAYLPITTAVWRAHRAIAHAAKKDFEAAEREFADFRAAKAAVPEESVFGGDPSHRILTVSELFIEGEIALQKGELDRAEELLVEAVEVEESLSYGEPPQWLQPTRHTLGAVYLEAGRYVDAEHTYRADLAEWPDNGWSLYGLARALQEQGKDVQASEVMRQYEQVWAEADEPTTTSCKCIPEV